MSHVHHLLGCIPQAQLGHLGVSCLGSGYRLEREIWLVVIWYIIKPYPWILMVIMVNLNQLYDLVGGAITILKNMSSSMGRMIPYIMEK